MIYILVIPVSQDLWLPMGFYLHYLSNFHWLMTLPPYIRPQAYKDLGKYFGEFPNGYITASPMSSWIWIWLAPCDCHRALTFSGHHSARRQCCHHSCWVPEYFGGMVDTFLTFTATHCLWPIYSLYYMVWLLFLSPFSCISSLLGSSTDS